jgi:hypothetical protein
MNSSITSHASHSPLRLVVRHRTSSQPIPSVAASRCATVGSVADVLHPHSIRDLSPARAEALRGQFPRHSRYYARLAEQLHKWIPGIDDDSYAMLLAANRVHMIIRDLQCLASRSEKERDRRDDPEVWNGWGI